MLAYRALAPGDVHDLGLPLAAVLATAASLALGWVLAQGVEPRYLVLVALGLLIVGVGFVVPRTLLYGLAVWLVALGLLRRLASESLGETSTDPLLLVAPFAFGVLALVAAYQGVFQRLTSLSKAVIVLSGLVLLSALNPGQDSVVAGIASLLFAFIPLLGFWIGRAFGDAQLVTRVLQLVAGLAIVAAVYGLAQTRYGFLPWDEEWVRQQRDYSALSVFTAAGGQLVTRPFGTFSSASEYAYFLGIAFVVLAVYLLRRRFIVAMCAGLALLGVGLLLASSRSVLVAALIALTLILGATRRIPMTFALVLAAGAVLLLPFILQRWPVGYGGAGTASTLIGHQVEGLRDPLNPATSTLGIHAELVGDGIRSAVANPLGTGLSSITIAGAKFGSKQARGTEADPSNMAVAAGLPGLLAYLVVLVLAFQRVFRMAVRTRSVAALLAVGVVTLVVLHWLDGGQYAVAWLPWFIIGWADREELSTTTDSPRQAPA